VSPHWSFGDQNKGVGRKTKDSGVDGLLVVDKPAGWTSHDVVAKCRGAYGQRRCGHSGTLDPDATGVLLVGFGNATKLLTFLTDLPKTYTTEMVMGSTTNTLDDSGETLERFDMPGLTVENLQTAAQQFVGNITQIPPMVSAVQVGGVRLHELARQGIEIERAPRPVTVYRYDIVSALDNNVFGAEVVCGSGTYVRTLVDDLGRAVGGGAHLRNLRRTVVGSFAADGGDSPLREGFGDRSLVSPADALRDYGEVRVDDAMVSRIRNGVVLERDEFGTGEITGPQRVLDASGELLAVYEASGKRFRPLVVLPVRVHPG
jgi:tRNA pseudouridine55 synthase